MGEKQEKMKNSIKIITSWGMLKKKMVGAIYSNYTIAVILFFSVYCIAVIGLDINKLKIMPLKDAIKVNTILINISYSFIAGAIFYFFINYLPNKKRKREINFILLENVYLLKVQIAKIGMLFTIGEIIIPIQDYTNKNYFIDMITKNAIKKGENRYSIKELDLCLENVKVEFANIFNYLHHYEVYFSTNEITLLYAIKTSHFLSYIQYYIEMKDDFDNSLINDFAESTSNLYCLILKLENSLNKNV